ncbi:MAG TPA: glycosyltransferase [Pirellulaceae bacterium]|nr:glycosyltransferase [Pirellulaceae bacterium]
MPLPLVSVVIPTYNYGHLVGEAVQSVLAQNYSMVEIIVVDDGSTDDTREQLARFEGRIRYHYQPNAGLSAARNTGIGLAKGQLIALLDSDDAFHPQKLAIQETYLAANPDVGLVATTSFSGEPIRWQEIPAGDVPDRRVRLEDVVLKSRFAPSSVLVRRECLDWAGPFDPELKSVEDREMWIRIATHDRMALIDLPLTWYRQTPGSMSRNAAKMEDFESLVLDRAFAMSEVRSNWTLRRKAKALAALAASRRYQGAMQFGTAFRRLWSSFIWWPLPFGLAESVPLLGRVRLAVAMTRQLIGSYTRSAVARPKPAAA